MTRSTEIEGSDQKALQEEEEMPETASRYGENKKINEMVTLQRGKISQGKRKA